MTQIEIIISFVVMMPLIAMLIPEGVNIFLEIREDIYMRKENKKVNTEEWYENRGKSDR